jgi:hypothetical protein
MRIIKLKDITVVSSTADASTYDEYSSVATYDAEDYVKVSFESDGSTPRTPVVEYQSLAGSNTGNYPPDDPVNWLEIGAANDWKMFDGYINTQTTDGEDLTVVINANQVDTVALFNITGSSVNIKHIHNSVTLSEQDYTLRTYTPKPGWYNWIYDTYEYDIRQVIHGFTRYGAGATLEITVTPAFGTAAVGLVVIGSAVTLGETYYDVKSGINDYSIKDTDSLGRTYLAQGAYARRADAEIWLANSEVDQLHRQLVDIRGQAAVIDLNNTGVNYESLVIYGFVQNFDVIIPGPIRSKCNLEIKGLT